MSVVLRLFILLLLTASLARAQESATLNVGKSRLEVIFSERVSPALRGVVLDWVGRGARAVTAYHQRFPVERVKIRVQVRAGRGPSGGTTYG